MKICVVGAGAIGGLLAVRLAEAGEELTVVDQVEIRDIARRVAVARILRELVRALDLASEAAEDHQRVLCEGLRARVRDEPSDRKLSVLHVGMDRCIRRFD